MRIVIVSAYFFPYNSPRANRATELAKELARQGHTVRVYTLLTNADYPAIEKEFGIEIKGLGKRTWKVPSFGKSKLAYFFNRVSFRFLQLGFEFPDIEFFFLVKKALKLESDNDLLISSAFPYPIHWGVAKVRSKNLCSVWVADCGDPYMGCKTDTFKKPFYFKYVEKWFCRKADYLSVPVEEARSAYYPEFHSKIKVIPQGFNFTDIHVYNGEIRNEVPTFAYAGTFIRGIRDPRRFLEYLCNYPRPYKFIVYTINTDMVAPYVERSQGRIELRSAIPRKDLLLELSKMDFLVNFTNGTNVQSPSKLIDYAMVKRPVLSIEPGNFDVAALMEFIKGDYQSATIINNVEQYNIRNVVQLFLKLVPTYTKGQLQAISHK